jgi:hypothetical protein
MAAAEKCLVDQNWYAGLMTALTLPDIAVRVEHGSTNGARYAGIIGPDAYGGACITAAMTFGRLLRAAPSNTSLS